MRSVLAALQTDAKEIFTKTDKNPSLNKVIVSFNEATKLSEQAALKPKVWKQLSEALAAGESQLEEFRKNVGLWTLNYKSFDDCIESFQSWR